MNARPVALIPPRRRMFYNIIATGVESTGMSRAYASRAEARRRLCRVSVAPAAAGQTTTNRTRFRPRSAPTTLR